MLDSSKQLLDLFHKNNNEPLYLMDYFIIDDYEKAIRELENLGIITVCSDVVGSIELN